MSPADLRAVLGWCSLINLAILMVWFLFLASAHDWVYRLHRRWFDLSPAVFDAMHYAGMGLFKIGILLFNLIPYLVLRLVG